jgi:hypothetical protein
MTRLDVRSWWLIVAAALLGSGTFWLMARLHAGTPWRIIAATLIGAVFLWIAAPKWKMKGEAFLVLMVSIAGGTSAWLSVRYPQSAGIIFVAAVALSILVWALFHKLGKNVGTDLIAWRKYLSVQGAMLVLSLVLGGAIAWVGFAKGPYAGAGKITEGGQLLKFENLDPSQHPVYEEVNVRDYSEISIFTKTGAPANGSATVGIYIEQGDAARPEFGHLNSRSSGWSGWRQANAGKHMSLVVGPPSQPGANAATQVDILVYLSPK